MEMNEEAKPNNPFLFHSLLPASSTFRKPEFQQVVYTNEVKSYQILEDRLPNVF